MVTLLWVVGGALAISFLCSILEAVLLSVTHSYVAVLRERGDRAGDLLQKMQRDIDEPIAAILTLNTIAHTLGATMGGAIALEVFGDPWVGLFGALLTLAVLLFSEILPKTLGAVFWKELGRPAAYVLRGMVVVMKPILIPLSAFSRLVNPKRKRPKRTISRSELEVLAHIGRREGALDEDEWRVMTRVIQLDEIEVGEVMTPRTDIVGVPLSASLDEAKTTMLEEGHLRLPVYDGVLDRVVGILLARDLLSAERNGETGIANVMRPAQFFPTTKSVEDLITEMRTHRTKMAIVVDEFGGTAGLVTLEDLIEEIIGEIQDEHEADEPVDFLELGSGLVRVWGAVPVREVNERLGLALPDEHHDTIGGYVFGELDRLPRVGDQVQVEDGTFRVVRVIGRRIEYLVFKSLAE